MPRAVFAKRGLPFYQLLYTSRPCKQQHGSSQPTPYSGRRSPCSSTSRWIRRGKSRQRPSTLSSALTSAQHWRRRAPNAAPPAEHGEGVGKGNSADYRMLGVQTQRRQTLIQEVEFRYAAPVAGPTASPPTVEHLHIMFPALSTFGRHLENRLRNLEHDAHEDPIRQQPAAWMRMFGQQADPISQGPQ